MSTVSIFAPIGRDGPLTLELLARIGVDSAVFPSLTALCEAGLDDAGAVLLTEEALESSDFSVLTDALSRQPGWSDIPVLVFAGGDRSRASLRMLETAGTLSNVTIVERPIRIAAVFSIVRAALRARQRQYEMRDVLVRLHAAREEAERASRLKDEFLATLSHELRTPLNAILGWTAMLRQNSIEPERIPHVHEILERNATAQAQLIADVLDVSRLITGKMRLQPQPVHLASVVADAVDTVRPAAQAKGVAIVLDTALEFDVLQADPDRLRQVVWNLLTNAVKFTPSGGEVRVTLSRHADVLELAVADTGAGLPSDFIPYAFDRFRQADQTFTRSHGGLGLGLAIVKHVVEMHGGEVAVESEGVGRGAVFTVRLPVAGAREEAIATERRKTVRPPLDTPDADFTGRLILVVDDDAATRELMIALLTSKGARVTTVASAADALAVLDDELPALIVADIGMPEEDGLSLFRRLRKRSVERGGLVPAVALSAYARAEDREAALAAGFDAFVAKPAAPADLLATIVRTLDVR